jgi:hypothetical protein
MHSVLVWRSPLVKTGGRTRPRRVSGLAAVATNDEVIVRSNTNRTETALNLDNAELLKLMNKPHI